MTDTDHHHLPRTFWWWLSGTALSLVGTHALAFGMAWAASGISGVLAGLVLTAVVLPRVLLSLTGGSAADRVGPWRIMVAGDTVMIGVTLTLALVVGRVGAPAALLLVAALAVGLVDAFYLPASGSLPRHLVPRSALPRALAARQLAGQAAVLVGAPVGGVLVAHAGLAAVALADAASFALMLAMLLVLRERMPGGRVAEAGSRPHGVLEGLRVVGADRVLRLCLLLVLSAAALLIPVTSLLVPLLGRDRAWSPATAGTVVGAVALGTAVVAITVLMRSGSSRPGVAGPLGLLLAAGGVAGLVVPVPAAGAVACGAVIGSGTGLFTAHVGPLVLGQAPAGTAARVQALLVVAQSLPLLLGNGMLGALADGMGAGYVLTGSALLLAGVSVAALSSPALRAAT